MPPMKSFTIDLGEKPPDPEEVGSLYHLSLSTRDQIVWIDSNFTNHFRKYPNKNITLHNIVMSIVQIDWYDSNTYFVRPLPNKNII